MSIGSPYTHHVQQALLYSYLVVVSGVRKVITFFPASPGAVAVIRM